MIANTNLQYRLGFLKGLFCLLAFSWITGKAIAAGGSIPITVHVKKSDVTIGQIGEYTKVELADGNPVEEKVGSPELPARFINVLIPSGAKVTKVEAKSNDVLLANDILLYPHQPPRSPSLPVPPFAGPDAKDYKRNVKMPNQVAELVSPRNMRGYTYVCLRLNPVRYIPKKKELYLATTIQVTLHYTLPGSPNLIQGRHQERFKKMINRMVVNPEAEAVCRPKIRGSKPKDSVEPKAIKPIIIGKEEDSVPLASMINLSASEFSVDETAGSIEITVQRSGDTSEPETVDYATSDGSATAGSDYTDTSGTLTFAVGELSKTINIPILDDGDSEFIETFIIMLSNNANLVQPSIGRIDIIDDDNPGELAFSSVEYSGAEDSGSVIVTVTRMNGSNGAASVQYTTTDGTATAGSDYESTTGTLNWADGDTSSKTFTVSLINDSDFEGPDETVVLSLSDATGAVISSPDTATLTINDDDNPGELAFSSVDYSGAEDSGSVVVTVIRENGSNGAASVQYSTADGTATAGSDYESTTGTLNWADGDSSSKTFTVSIMNDTEFEGLKETVNLSLSDATGAVLGSPDTATLSITEDDPNPDQVDYLIITNDAMKAAFQSLADHRAAHDGFKTKVITTEMIYATYDGTKPNGGSDNQTRIRNCIKEYVETSGTLYVVLGGDNTIVPDRDCYVYVGTYVQNDMPTDFYYAGLDGTWDEDADGIYGEAYTDSVDLTADVIVGRIPVRTTDQVNDYLSKVFDYDAGNSTDISRKFMISGHTAWDNYTGTNRPGDTNNDGHMSYLDDNHPTVSDVEMWLRRIYRDRVQAYGWEADTFATMFNTITSWDDTIAGSYQCNASNLVTRYSEGWNFLLNFTHGNTTVMSQEGGDFWATDASSLTGMTNFLYTCACLTGGFDKAEPSLSEAMLRNPNGGALVYLGCSRYGWGLPDTPPASYTSTGGPSASYAGYWFEEVFKNKVIDSGQAFINHKARLTGSSSYNGEYRWIYFGLNFQGDPALKIQGVTTMVNASVDQDVLTEDNPGTATVTFTRVGDTASSLTVNYTLGGTATVDGDFSISNSSSVTIPAGQDTATVTINILDDTETEGDETVVLTISPDAAYVASVDTATVTLWDDEGPGRVRFTAHSASVNEEAGSIYLTVERVTGSTGAISVDYASADGSAIAGSDYTATSGTLNWADGETASKTINVPIISDGSYESDETFSVTLSNETGGVIIETPSSTTVTITNDDYLVSIDATDASATEGLSGTGTYTITREGPTDQTLTVNYAFDSGGSTANSDEFSLDPTASVTFSIGEMTKNVILTPVDDSEVESDETVRLTITADSAYTIGTPSSADITIIDNDTNHTLTVINGTGDGSYLADTGVSIVADAPPTGYSFSNWTASPDSGSFADPNAASTTYTMPNNAVEVTANYQPADYTVTFDKQGGAGGDSSVSATYDSAMPTATAPTRVGYSFEGYFIDSECTGTQYYNADMSSAHIWDITSDTTLYAKWATGPLVVPIVDIFVHNEKDNYTGNPQDVINGSGMNGYGIDGNPGWPAGEGLPDTWTATSNDYKAEHQGKDLLAAQTPAEDFDTEGNLLGDGVGPTNGKIGWFVFDLGASHTKLKNLYLWHIRETATRVITDFNVYVAETPTVTVPHGPADTTSRDYDFASGGWTEIATGLTGTWKGNQVIDLGGVTVRYIGIEIMNNGGDLEKAGLAEVAVTKENTPPATYTLTVNNGTGGGDYEEGSEVAISATVPEGQHFVNWTGDTANLADANSASTTVTMPASAVTVTANFAINQYTVTFVEGSHGSRTGGGDLIQTVDHGSAAIAPTITADNGYIFTGWDTAFDNVTSDMTVTAEYAHEGTPHSADSNSDWSIDQDEVNSFIGQYANNNNTVTDDVGSITDGRITMREVMRVIYLYNQGGEYIGGQGTVDTYDVAAAPTPSVTTTEIPVIGDESGGTLVVSNAADSGEGSLRDAIAMAADGETITIDDSVDTITVLSEIIIDKSITIDGNGAAIVSGENQTRIFRIENAERDIDVTLKNMGITDAENSADEFGGAIYNNSQTLTLDTVLLDGNENTTDEGKGGAVYSSGTINVDNCVFRNNTASEENDIYQE